MVKLLLIAFCVSVSLLSAHNQETEALAKVKGRVLNTFGRSLINAKVRLYAGKTLIKETATNEDALYGFNMLPPGLYRCNVARAGSGQTRSFDREFELKPGESKSLDLMALMLLNDVRPFTSDIAGFVRDSVKNPKEAVIVKLINPFYQQVIAETATNKDGDFHFIAPFQGQFVIQAWSPGYLVSVQQVLALGDTVNIEINLGDLRFR